MPKAKQTQRKRIIKDGGQRNSIRPAHSINKVVEIEKKVDGRGNVSGGCRNLDEKHFKINWGKKLKILKAVQLKNKDLVWILKTWIKSKWPDYWSSVSNIHQVIQPQTFPTPKFIIFKLSTSNNKRECTKSQIPKKQT